MRPLTNLATLTIALGLVLGCSDEPVATGPDQADDAIAQLPGYSLSANGGASANPDCVWEKGQEFFVPVPVNDTDFVLADVRMRQATCVIRPNGSRLFHVVHEVVSDIPLPQSKLTVRGLGPDGELQEYNLFLGDDLIFSGSFPCGWIEPDVEPTFDWEFSLTPGGINISTCRWDAE